MIRIGDKAPGFQLVDSDRQPVSLADYRGRTLVLLFFPFAYSSTCTKELCLTRDEFQEYDDLKAEILAVSVDSHHSLRQFKADYDLNFRLASDFNKEAIEAYDVKYETFGLGLKGVAKRSAFVIDAEGIVRYAEVLENASDMPDFDKLKAVLSELQPEPNPQ
jgi:peroxiredoxin